MRDFYALVFADRKSLAFLAFDKLKRLLQGRVVLGR